LARLLCGCVVELKAHQSISREPMANLFCHELCDVAADAGAFAREEGSWLVSGCRVGVRGDAP
jgi:hypothetical protein